MGLNEDYDYLKDQILLMDPLPSLSKVYSMILKVEKQRAAHVMNTESSNVTALLATSHVFNNINGQGGKDVPQAKLEYNVGHSFAHTKGIPT